MRVRAAIVALVVILVAAGRPADVSAQEAPKNEPVLEIQPLKGSLYEVTYGLAHTVFLVTRDGIVLVDPLTRAAATALKAQLDMRFPGVPVRYVVLTHHHADRAAGAAVFIDAHLVAQRNYGDALATSRRTKDLEYRFVRDVRDTFDTSTTISIGGTTVELVHVRSTHAPEMTVVYFPEVKLLFAVAPPPVTVVPFSFDAVGPKDAFGWIDPVAALAPDTLMFDDGMTADGGALRHLSTYLNALRQDVGAQYERGRSLAEILASPSSQTGGPHTGARASHIAALYRAERLLRIEVSGSAIGSYMSRNASSFCGGVDVCASGGLVPAASAGLSVTFGNRFGVTVEGTVGQQFWSARARQGFQEETALRLSRGASLWRYGAARPGRIGYLPVAGLSQTTGSMRGLTHVTGVLTPVGGYHDLAGQETKLGLTAGVDLVKTTNTGFSFRIPLRATFVSGAPDYWPSRFDLQAGIGLSVPVVRRLTVH